MPRRMPLATMLLATLLALFVARPLLPSEGALTADGEGLPFVLLTLIVAGSWLIDGLFRNRLDVSLSWADGPWLALIFFQGLSAWHAAQAGAARSSINLFWEWFSLGLGFFLARQLIDTPRKARATTAAMLGLAAALSAYGLHEYFVSAPETRAKYRQHPETLLRELGISPEAGSAERLRFEKRLESSEPMATFALTNSLAGVLAPWLIVGAGIAIANRQRGSTDKDANGRQGYVLVMTGSAIIIASTASCLLLTKSRSAWLATAAGAAGLCLGVAGQGRRFSRRAAAISALGLFALITAAISAGSLDRQVLTEASKSLGYRWQYWQASLAMIKDHPWLGCAPGNFQDEYTRYKLPQASEVVADPHNLIFEVWATCGTPAMLAFLAIFAAIGYELFRGLQSAAYQPSISSAAASTARPFPAPAPSTFAPAQRQGIAEQEQTVGDWKMIAGGGIVGGFLLAYFIGMASTVNLPLGAAAGGLIVSAAIVWLLTPWIREGALPPALPTLAAIVLLINLMAAGGIAFPGVASSLWLLLALGLSLAGMESPRFVLAGRAAMLAAGAAVVAIGVFIWSDYLPVMRCRLFLLQAESAVGKRRMQLLESAAAADPRSDEPWRSLAAIEIDQWRKDGAAATFKHWEQAAEEANKRRPRSAAAQMLTGNHYLEAYRATHEAADLDKAIVHYQRGIELYPSLAENQARLALALAAAGQPAGARKAAAEALRLHRLTPHEDQKLSAELLVEVERLKASDSVGPRRAALQL